MDRALGSQLRIVSTHQELNNVWAKKGTTFKNCVNNLSSWRSIKRSKKEKEKRKKVGWILINAGRKLHTFDIISDDIECKVAEYFRAS